MTCSAVGALHHMPCMTSSGPVCTTAPLAYYALQLWNAADLFHSLLMFPKDTEEFFERTFSALVLMLTLLTLAAANLPSLADDNKPFVSIILMFARL